MEAGQKIGPRIDQTLTQDTTGTMVMLELEAMHLSRVKTELSADRYSDGAARSLAYELDAA